jgi:hypothetical protein
MSFDKNNPRYLEQLLAAGVAHSRENHRLCLRPEHSVARQNRMIGAARRLEWSFVQPRSIREIPRFGKKPGIANFFELLFNNSQRSARTEASKCSVRSRRETVLLRLRASNTTSVDPQPPGRPIFLNRPANIQ